MAGLLQRPRTRRDQVLLDEMRACPKPAGSGWVFTFTPAVIPADPTWHESAAGVPQIQRSQFCISIRPAGNGGGGAARPDLSARHPAARPLVGAFVSLPLARIPTLRILEPADTQPRLAALPLSAPAPAGLIASLRQLADPAITYSPGQTGGWPLAAARPLPVVAAAVSALPAYTAPIAWQPAVFRSHAPLPAPLAPAARGLYGPVPCELAAAVAPEVSSERPASAPFVPNMGGTLSDVVRQPELVQTTTLVKAGAVSTEARVAAPLACVPTARGRMALPAHEPAGVSTSFCAVEAFGQPRQCKTGGASAEARVAAPRACVPTAQGPMALPVHEPAGATTSFSPVEAFGQPHPYKTASLMQLDFGKAMEKAFPVALGTLWARSAQILLPTSAAMTATRTFAPAPAADPDLQSAGLAAAPVPLGTLHSQRLPLLPGITQALLPTSAAMAAARTFAPAPPADPDLQSAGLAAAPVPLGTLHCQRLPLLPDIGATLPSDAPLESGAAGAPLATAPLASLPTPQPAAPPAASPRWSQFDVTVVSRNLNSLAPQAVASIARTGTLARPLDILVACGSKAGRTLRSCAVFWTLRTPHMYSPALDLRPITEKLSDLLLGLQGLPYSIEDRPAKAKVLPIGKRRTRAASPSSKWFLGAAAAAALLLGAVLRPPAASSGFGEMVTWKGASIRQVIATRATRSMADDFRSGLNQWKGLRESLPKGWSYNPDGYMHPGQLAIYRPSVPLSDYRLEFMAQVESKSVDWVVRARDANNYYALKFTVVEPGPRPMVAMVRYPVIEGSRGTRVQTPLRMMIHANTPYRVTVDVKGSHYRAYIEGQEADYWTEDGLKTGGVGFFSEAGERARVYWVKLESHDDLLGRICALLAGKTSEGGTNTEKQAMDYRHSGTIEMSHTNGAAGEDLASHTAQEARISRVLSKAASFHLEGKRDEAAQELRRAIDGGERHPALFFALGQLQYELQDHAAAAQSYAQAALLQPLHPTAHFNTGVCLAKLERWEEATESFHMAISNDPARTEAHLALGACLVHVGRYNEALDAYDRFLARHPDNEEGLFGKAVALQKREHSSEAAELYRRILARNPSSEEALSNLVSLSLANQDYEQVRKYAQRLTEVHPRSQVALEGLAAAAFAAGDHAAAADFSRKLAELAPQVFENWFNLGVACHKSGDLPHASEAYARAAKLQPESPQAHLNLGVALHELADLRGANAAYQRALEIDPNLAGVHWNLGLVSEQLGDTEAAEKFYSQIPANSPDSEDATFRIGHLRLARGNYPGSIEAFQSCLERRPNWPEARLNLGIAHWRSGDKEAARACFQELSASGGETKEALRGLAALALERQEYDKAFEIYRQLIDSGDRSPELLYNAALICQRRGETEDAAVLYREAIKVDPLFGEALLNLGHALMTLGNEFEARSCWRKAVIAKPELAHNYFEPAQAT